MLSSDTILKKVLCVSMLRVCRAKRRRYYLGIKKYSESTDSIEFSVSGLREIKELY